MNDITSSDGALVISHEKIPFTAYQAIYHKITRRVEVLARRYKDPYRINADDIANLSYRLNQILAQYAVKGQRVQISHSIKEGFSSTFSSLEKFKRADMSHRECTSSFDFELDFLIVLPAEIPQADNIAQRYKLNLTYQRGFIDDSDIFTPYFMDAFRTRSSMSMRLEYSDYAVAQTINATIQSWINGLPKVEVKSVIKWIMKHEEAAQRHISVIIGSVAPISAAMYLTNHALPIRSAFVMLLISFVLFEITSSITSQIVDNGYSVVRRVAADIEIILTKGDIERLNSNERKNLKIRSFAGFAFITLGVSLLVNLFSSWFYDLLVAGR